MTPDVKALLDEREIISIALRYARSIDTHDLEGFLSCFTEDALYGFAGSQVQGHRKLAWTVDATARLFSAGQHQTTNFEVTLDGDRAAMRSCYLATQVWREPASDPLFVMGGLYDDILTRTPQGWRIANRLLTNLWTKGDAKVIAAAGFSHLLA
ncbi:MAG: nuclear transport factor 2 family protein [Caulobacteraceae bacterium]|nr:nuclear transport factor 2 family protein [Caulobacteraceae bacterium]